MSEDLPRPSKYRTVQRSNGFTIDAPDRNRVFVEIRSTHFRVSDGNPQERVGLVEYRRLLDQIAWDLMRDWEPPVHDRKPWPGIKRWAVGKTSRAIAGQVYQQWQRLVSRADARIVGVQKSIFAATFGCAEITLNPEFYRNRFLVRDVMEYRAAAVAVRHAECLTRLKQRNQNQPPGQVTQHGPSAVKTAGHLKLIMSDGQVSEATQMTYLQRWLDLFSAGPAYKSLRRTLMNLPGGIAGRLLVNLPRVHLERPVIRRLELMGLLLASEHSNQINQQIFQFATEDRIRVAMELVGRSVGRRLSTRSTHDVDWFIDQLASYPDPHHGNIVGLAEKTVRWQRDMNACKLRDMIAEYGRDRLVEHPPVEFPDAPEIRFLATPGEICAESIRMHHCVETFIPDAIEGHAYIFHADKFACSATILVDGNGEFCLASGPFNQPNRACRWATRVLRRWSRTLGPRAAREKQEVSR